MLTDLELYLFDTCGFVMLPGVFADRVTELKAELAPLLSTDDQGDTRYCPDLPHTRSCHDLPTRSPKIRSLAEDAAIVNRVHPLINQPMRLIECYAVRRAADSKFPLHSGQAEPLIHYRGTPTLNLSKMHTCHNGRLYCMFIKVLIYLDDVSKEDDGPFCYIQGSHKANFSLLPLLKGSSSPEHTIADRGFPTLAIQPVKAGDMLLLNEALMHGTLNKRSNRSRELLALSYAPAFVADWHSLDEEDIAGAAGHYHGAFESDIWTKSSAE